MVTGVAFSAQAIIDLLFSVKHSLTRAMLHKYLYVHRLYIDCIDTHMLKWDQSHSYAHGTPFIPPWESKL